MAGTAEAGFQNVLWDISEELGASSPWIKLFGFGSLLVGIIVVVVGILLILGNVTDPVNQDLKQIITGSAIVLGAAMWIVPAVKLLSICKSIASFRDTQRQEDLDEVISSNRAFWGIATVMLSIIAALQIVAYVLGAVIGT